MRRIIFHAEIVGALSLASALIAILPFRRIAQMMQSKTGATPIDSARALRIRNALHTWAARVPWHAMCFQQGLAAQLLLRRRHRAATIYYGAAHDTAGKLVAHVWVKSGVTDVIGCDNVDRYGLLMTFPEAH